MSFHLFLLSALSSLIASFIFLIVILVFLRPAIKTSKCIVLALEEGKPCYRIKFYNTSIFSAYDADVSLVALEERAAAPKGKHTYYQEIALGKNKFSVIHRWLPMCLAKNYAHNCTQVKTFENLEEILKDQHKTLQLKITLRHGLTGLSKTFVKDYHTESSLAKGLFEFGNTFAVIQNSY